MSRKRPSEPFYVNCIEAIKVDRMLMETGAYLTMSDASIRLYLICCWWFTVLRNGHIHIPYVDLPWTREQVDTSAAELGAAGLLIARPQQHDLEVTLPDRSCGRIKHPPPIDLLIQDLGVLS